MCDVSIRYNSNALIPAIAASSSAVDCWGGLGILGPGPEGIADITGPASTLGPGAAVSEYMDSIRPPANENNVS